MRDFSIHTSQYTQLNDGEMCARVYVGVSMWERVSECKCDVLRVCVEGFYRHVSYVTVRSAKQRRGTCTCMCEFEYD